MAESKTKIQVTAPSNNDKTSNKTHGRVAELQVQDGKLVVDDRDLNPGVRV